MCQGYRMSHLVNISKSELRPNLKSNRCNKNSGFFKITISICRGVETHVHFDQVLFNGDCSCDAVPISFVRLQNSVWVASSRDQTLVTEVHIVQTCKSLLISWNMLMLFDWAKRISKLWKSTIWNLMIVLIDFSLKLFMHVI